MSGVVGKWRDEEGWENFKGSGGVGRDIGEKIGILCTVIG